MNVTKRAFFWLFFGTYLGLPARMRAAIFAFVFAGAAFLNCGGQVDGDSDGGFPCPVTNPGTTSCANEDAQCTFQATMCGHPITETCTCSHGEWSCPVSSCPQVVCPSEPTQGMGCYQKGQVCSGAATGQCPGVQCTCDGTSFQCVTPDCAAPACPAPDTVAPGKSCSLPQGVPCATTSFTCDGGVSNSVFCECTNGLWACNGPTPVCSPVVDANLLPDAGMDE